MTEEKLFFDYVPETNAIYVLPLVCVNYGYMLKNVDYAQSSNTYTFICKRNPNVEMFIAPISRKTQFSVNFMSYRKYCEKIQSKIKKNRMYAIKKSNTYPGLKSNKNDDLKNMGEIFDFKKAQKIYEKVNKMMEIFNTNIYEDSDIKEHDLVAHYPKNYRTQLCENSGFNFDDYFLDDIHDNDDNFIDFDDL